MKGRYVAVPFSRSNVMLNFFSILFKGLSAFARGFLNLGQATEEVTSVLEVRAKLYSLRENHRLESEKAKFLNQLEVEDGEEK